MRVSPLTNFKLAETLARSAFITSNYTATGKLIDFRDWSNILFADFLKLSITYGRVLDERECHLVFTLNTKVHLFSSSEIYEKISKFAGAKYKHKVVCEYCRVIIL